jgi:hypothetical protein
LDQLKLAISGCVKELHEYAVPRQIITTTPAKAMSHRFGVVADACVDISFSNVRARGGNFFSRLRACGSFPRIDGDLLRA